ncbi:MAG: hypothetical protein ACLUSP_06105 [Christensenellales bacterium]
MQGDEGYHPVNNGGFTYMFNETLDASRIKNIIIRMDCMYSPNHIWLGAMNGMCRGGSFIDRRLAAELAASQCRRSARYNRVSF